MPGRLLTVVETALFQRQAETVWDEAERERFIDFIALHPEDGDVIPETGGVRKLRWTRSGGGKRGGARVIYFYHDRNRPLYLLMAARKSDAGAEAGRAKDDGRSQGRKVVTKTAEDDFGRDLIESLAQASAHARGEKVAAVRVTAVEVPDVRAIRRALRMSQSRFASAFRIPLATLKNWEQGRRYPDAPAAALLLAIQRRPKEVMEALAG